VPHRLPLLVLSRRLLGAGGDVGRDAKRKRGSAKRDAQSRGGNVNAERREVMLSYSTKQ
jgi:hypothetical protein